MTSSTPNNTKLTNLSFSKKLLAFAHRTGITRFGRRLFAKSLTVLNYHRIDRFENNQDMFQPNISASPEAFDEQMAYISRWYRVVSLQDITNWLLHNTPLPPYATLITFDDGYLDNYTNALPILKKYDFPAVIYLTSGHIASNHPFYWDMASYCFFRTQTDSVRFADNTEQTWSSIIERNGVLKKWVESMKILEENEKQKWVSNLPEQLGVSIPDNFFQNKMLNWEQVREMRSFNIEFGAHTITHPILTRISLEKARQEISGSKQKIEEELGESISSFAYPNGMQADFNEDILRLTKDAGLVSAFTLLNGPTSLSEAKKSPYSIRRIFISHRHTIAHFSTLVSPLNRIRKN